MSYIHQSIKETAMHQTKKMVMNLGILLAVVVMTSCAGSGDSNKVYGAPEAQVSNLPYTGPHTAGPAINQLPDVKPAPVENSYEVRLDVTHKQIEIADGVKIMAWTFGDSVPGPVVHVKEGDRIKFVMTNRTQETADIAPPMPHSIDFHAAMVNPKDKYRMILPGQTLSFEWTANYPGVFMYHCGTPMILHHMISGMYGMVIVDPKEGYGTKVDREYAIVQSEFYVQKMADGNYAIDLQAALNKQPSYVTFNGVASQYVKTPLISKAGERVRLYVLNVGPNDTSSFHVVGTILDKVWLDGNPTNELHGMQTVLLGSSSAAVAEFVIPEKGTYIMVDHEFADVEHGAVGLIKADE